MSRNFSQRPSDLLQIDDDVVALDFDLACATRLFFYDGNLEKLRLDAMTMGQFSKAMTGGGTMQKTYVGEIGPSTDFGDKGF